ncbi:hypothetical protein Mapa_006827 [Marchantia paleacea]|nr:hypothetical protein Mapa_006827 [Marchantia paleacea]
MNRSAPETPTANPQKRRARFLGFFSHFLQAAATWSNLTSPTRGSLILSLKQELVQGVGVCLDTSSLSSLSLEKVRDGVRSFVRLFFKGWTFRLNTAGEVGTGDLQLFLGDEKKPLDLPFDEPSGVLSTSPLVSRKLENRPLVEMLESLGKSLSAPFRSPPSIVIVHHST